MRWNDRSDGLIKTLLVLVLLLANIAAALFHRSTDSQLSGSAGAPPAVSRASRDTLAGAKSFLAGAPKRAGEGPALPGEPSL